MGHGGGAATDEYGLLTACASRHSPASVFRSTYLGAALREANRKVRAHLILDACYAAAAVADFNRPLGSRGLAVLASTSRSDKAIAARGEPTPFARALLAVLRRGVSAAEPTISLSTLHDLVRAELSATKTDDTVLPELHVPQQRDGDVSRIGIFPNPRLGYLARGSGEGRPWCAVISSADAAKNHFRATVNGVVNRYRSKLSLALGHPLAAAPLIVEADEVFRGPRAFEERAAAVCAADIAFFDLTRLEPAVLVLLGVRAVIRRGVTICSVSDATSAASMESPFLLRDVNIIRHGPDADVSQTRFGERALTGLSQLSRTPHAYSDLPAFDLMRQPLPDDEGATVKPYWESVLVLCSFGAEYTARNLRALTAGLKGAITSADDSDATPDKEPVVARTLDMGTPQVVSANLFLAMRLNDLCVCDLTQWRPNVLFELGVRLAAHEFPGLRRRRLVGSERGRARPRRSRAGTDRGPPSGPRGDPLPDGPTCGGRAENSVPYAKVVARHLRTRGPSSRADDGPWSIDELPGGSIYRVAWQYADVAHEPSAAPVLELLQEPFRDKPFSLRDWPFAFPPEYELSERTQRGVTERLVAAWLYAEHRFAGGAREDLPDDVVRHIRSVGTRLTELLRKSSDAADEDMMNRIHDRLTVLSDTLPMNQAEVLAEANRLSVRSNVYKARKEFDRSRRALQRSIALLSPWLTRDEEVEEKFEKAVAETLSDAYGQLGGLERREGEDNWDTALSAYREGRDIEQNPTYQIYASYNLVNALVLRILMRPDTLPSLRGEIVGALRTVGSQVRGKRRLDQWAWADYALLTLLNGQLDQAKERYDAIGRDERAANVYTSAIVVLRDLRDAVMPVDGPTGEIFCGAIEHLDGAITH